MKQYKFSHANYGAKGQMAQKRGKNVKNVDFSESIESIAWRLKILQ